MTYLLFYDYVPEMLTRRQPVRAAHLEHAGAYRDSGLLKLAGAVGETAEGAVFVFDALEATAVEQFVQADPYVANGLVTGWRVKPWNLAIGALS
jgi:uncharacterized protein